MNKIVPYKAFWSTLKPTKEQTDLAQKAVNCLRLVFRDIPKQETMYKARLDAALATLDDGLPKSAPKPWTPPVPHGPEHEEFLRQVNAAHQTYVKSILTLEKDYRQQHIAFLNTKVEEHDKASTLDDVVELHEPPSTFNAVSKQRFTDAMKTQLQAIYKDTLADESLRFQRKKETSERKAAAKRAEKAIREAEALRKAEELKQQAPGKTIAALIGDAVAPLDKRVSALEQPKNKGNKGKGKPPKGKQPKGKGKDKGKDKKKNSAAPAVIQG